MLAPALPLLGVAHDKTIKGMYNLSDDVPLLSVASLDQQLATEYKTDAHLVKYYPDPNPDGEPWSRCNKVLLPALREAGYDLHTRLLVLDYDNPCHTAWTAETYSFFFERLAAMPFDLLWSWHSFYTTKAGARFIYVLDKPIPVEYSEAKELWLIEQWHQFGFEMDENTTDWTRMYRMPRVMRDGQPSWTSPYFKFIHQGRTLPLDQVGDSLKKPKPIIGPSLHLEVFNEPQPDNEDALLLCFDYKETGIEFTEWYQKMKKRLRGRECFECLFNHGELAQTGGRDATIHQYVGQVISLSRSIKETTPAHIYGLFLEAVNDLAPDAQTPDWSRVLWGSIQRLWAKEQAKTIANEAEAQERAQNADELLDSMIDKMRTWCDHPALYREEQEEVRQWIKTKLIACCGGSYMLLTPAGYYEDLQLTAQQLTVRWRTLGLDTIIPLRVPNENGKGWRHIKADSLVNSCGTIVNSIEVRPGYKGGIVERFDKHNAALVFPGYQRNELLAAQATYDADVDEWLQNLFGDHYNEAVDWIQWALAFDEGKICALSIKGSPGAGKKLLTQGLAECLEVPSLADGTDLTGRFTYGLLNSPFLVVNEGWPPSSGGMHPADKFRQLTGAEPFRVEPKYGKPLTIINPVRIIFTSNNLDVVRMLTQSRDPSPEDREALAQRLMHFDVGDRASAYLALKGGMAHTAKPGRRWITGDSGEPSDYVIAKHFLYLWKSRTTPPGARSRFLVEGNYNSEVMYEMRTQSGNSSLVIEILLQLMNKPRLSDGICIHDNKLFVLTKEVLEYYRSNLNGTKERLTAQSISNVFKGLMSKNPPEGGFVLTGKHKMGRLRWYEIEPELLHEVAMRDGWTCPKLQDLINARTIEKHNERHTLSMAGQESQQGAANLSEPGRVVPVVPPQVVAATGEGASLPVLKLSGFWNGSALGG